MFLVPPPNKKCAPYAWSRTLSSGWIGLETEKDFTDFMRGWPAEGLCSTRHEDSSLQSY